MDDEIFHHEDDMGDYLKVMSCAGSRKGQLYFDTANLGSYMTHDRVTALHAALGAWLMDGNLTRQPVADNSLIDQLITKRVKQEIDRVLPLHLAPQAYVPEPDAEAGWGPAPEGLKYEDARPRRQPDPFAQFVASVKAAQDVVSRMYSATATGEGAGTWGTDGASPNGPVPQCQARGCGHEYADHIRHAAGMAEECVGTPRCACTRYRSQA